MNNNGQVIAVPSSPAPVPAPAAGPAQKSDLEYLFMIEKALRSVQNLIHEFHAGAVGYVERVIVLERELSAVKAENEMLKKGKG